MSDDSDSFIREVSEEVRRDRARGLWRRFGPFVIGGLIAVVVLAAGDAILSARREAAAQAAGDALIEASRSADPGARAAALERLGGALDAGPALVARLQRAGDLAASGDQAGALAIYADIAGGAQSGPLSELAALRAAMLRMELEGPQAGIEALRPLTGDDRAFRLLALEALGVAQLAAGEAGEARASFDRALADSAASEGLKARLTQLRAAAGGDAE